MVATHDGIILIDKSEGESSFDVVRKLRRALRLKKVGHAGTLDPFATGLLILLLGQGTKLTPYLQDTQKVYQATLRLGIETDTQDPTGRITQRRPVPDLDHDDIRATARTFIGEIEQAPPMFSAIKYQGRRAYKLARKGIKVELRKRTVRVHALKIMAIDLPDITMEVTCGGGTYIRSLAADLGKALGAGAHLRVLRRLRIGAFKVAAAFKAGEIRSEGADLLRKRIISLREALPHLGEVLIEDPLAMKIRQGYQLRWSALKGLSGVSEHPEGLLKLVSADELVAIVKTGALSAKEERGLKVMRVFR